MREIIRILLTKITI